MKFITAITITAFLSTQALAIDAPEPQPEPPSTTSSGGSDNGAAIGAALLLGLIIWSATRETQPENTLMTPRPTVRPDCQLNKLGNVVACQ